VGRRVVQVAIDAILRPHQARLNWRWQQAARRGIQGTLPRIAEVTAPLLVMHSNDDPSVSPRGSRLLHERAASKEKRLVMLEGQGHVLTRAPDLESVFGPVREFLREAFERQASGISNTNDGS
jgi:esterase/lipase